MQRAAFCSQCGQAAKESAKFCGKCGSEVLSIPSVELACPSCGQTAEDPTDRFCSACGSAMPPISDARCANPDCGLPMGPDFKFCAACGQAVKKPEPPPVSAFEVPKPQPAPRPAAKPAAKPVQTSGKRTGLLIAGGIVGVIGLGLLGMGVFNKLAASGIVGGYSTSPSTPTDAKADVWEGIRSKQAAEDEAMMKKIKEAGGEG